MYRIFLLIPVFLLMAGCVTESPTGTSVPLPSPTPESGIAGQVLIGPMCPVVRIDQPCPDEPYQATLTVLALSGEKVTQFQTDGEGKFRLSLPPGEYILHPETPADNPMALAGEIPFTVAAGQFTELEVSYDSGIR